MYKENPNQLYSQVHIVNNQRPISSNLSQPLRNDSNMVYPLGNVRPNLGAGTHGNAPSTSSTSLKNSINGNAPNTSNNGSAPTTISTPNYPQPLKVFCNFTKKQLKKREKKNSKYAEEKDLLNRYLVLVA